VGFNRQQLNQKQSVRRVTHRQFQIADFRAGPKRSLTLKLNRSAFMFNKRSFDPRKLAVAFAERRHWAGAWVWRNRFSFSLLQPKSPLGAFSAYSLRA